MKNAWLLASLFLLSVPTFASDGDIMAAETGGAADQGRARSQRHADLLHELAKTDGWSPDDPIHRTEMAGEAPKREISERERHLFYELSKTDGWDPSEIIYGPRELSALKRTAEPPVIAKPSEQELHLYRELSKSDGWDGEVVIPARG